MSGHNHFPHVEELGRSARGPTIWSQAGTASCHRMRNCKNNSISVVRAEGNELSIEWWFYDEARGRFAHASDGVRIARALAS
jgi:hypothetical protein